MRLIDSYLTIVLAMESNLRSIMRYFWPVYVLCVLLHTVVSTFNGLADHGWPYDARHRSRCVALFCLAGP